jgi:amidase
MDDAGSCVPRGLVGLVDALAAGEITSTELVTATLRRIEASQPALNAFRIVRVEAALAEAAQADRLRAAGHRLPLLGVPIAVKDDTDLAGECTMYGCAGDFPVKDVDADVVRRLRGAGAVIVGKTHTSEFGQWPFAESAAHGITRNPWRLDVTPGGSSAGSAAAVAAGLVPAAVGSDGAGSVRIPAAWTHLVGIKPSRGRVSSHPLREAFYGLTTHGPLARTVEDAALMLDVMSGGHPGDRHRLRPPPVPLRQAAGREPGRLRIAVSTRVPRTHVRARLHGDVLAALQRMAGVLAGLGHDVRPADPDYGLLALAFLPRSTVGVREWAARVPAPVRLDVRTRENVRLGGLLRGPALRAALAAERRQARRVGRIFHDFDVVLAPTTAEPPLPVGTFDALSGWRTDRRMTLACPMAWPWNVLGWPAINVPAGFARGGLPLGVQLLGPACAEPRLISLAAQLEAVEAWTCRRPPFDIDSGRPVTTAIP